MIRYISMRLLFALPALWLIVTLVFLLVHIVPGDPVQQMLGEGARAEDLSQMRHALGLDMPHFSRSNTSIIWQAFSTAIWEYPFVSASLSRR